MFKFIFLIFTITSMTGPLWACPGCAGSMDNPKDLTYVYVLAGFIALIYVPFFIIFKVIKNNKDANSIEPEGRKSDCKESEKQA